MGSLVMANAFQDKIRNKNIEENKDKNEEDEEDEEDEKEEITMMPMADMLNHKTGFNNVCPLYFSFPFNLYIYIFIVRLDYFVKKDY